MTRKEIVRETGRKTTSFLKRRRQLFKQNIKRKENRGGKMKKREVKSKEGRKTIM